MKKYIFYLIILIIFTGCSKEEIATNPTHDKRVLLSHSAYGSTPYHRNASNNYRYDTEGLLVKYTPAISSVDPSGQHQITFERDTKKRILKYISDTGEFLTYDYDTQDRVTKKSYYSKANTLASFDLYSYKTDSFKRVKYNAVGVVQDSSTYIYAANKKDIVTEKRYNSIGQLRYRIERKFGETKVGVSGLEALNPEYYNTNLPLLEETFNAEGVKTATEESEVKSTFEGYAEAIIFRSKGSLEYSREIRYTYITKD